MTDVVIVGAGLSGLSCAYELKRQGTSCVLLEVSDGIGGRARTDEMDGFLLDRGFQVLLTAYPEAQRVLDYPALKLRAFEPGALIRCNGRFRRIADPWRRPFTALTTVFSSVGTIADKLKLARLRNRLGGTNMQSDSAPETTTIQYLTDKGFSQLMIQQFFRPFFGGIFLESELATSARMFEFVFYMFSIGEAALPSSGMGAMAAQLAGRLPATSIRLRQQASKITPGAVTLVSGEEIRTRAVVVATDNRTAANLLPEVERTPTRGTFCFYFAARQSPISDALLVLNGEGRGPINNFCVPTIVAPSYAPEGQHLMSATVLGSAGRDATTLLDPVRAQLTDWFGKQVSEWRFLRTYWIPDALPALRTHSPENQDAEVRPGIYVCGDHRETASINGALASGRRAASAVLAALQKA